MNKNVFNVVWADDEIDNLADEFTIDALSARHIHLIGKVHNAVELESFLSNHKKNIDAVIVDANFSEASMETKSERDTSGLSYAHHLSHQFENIPFFLYTNRSDELIYEKFEGSKSFVNDFPRNKRWFSKQGDGEFDRMIEEIIISIEEMNTLSFKVRNKYPDEFEAARLIPNAENNLFKGFEYIYADDTDYSSIEDAFNPLRKIIEHIVDQCNKKDYFPYLSSLNSLCKLLNMEETEGFKMNYSIMPSALVHSLKYALAIIQDGSHDMGKLALQVADYVRDTKNHHLYASVFHVVMDLLLWYKDLLNNENFNTGDYSGNYEAKGKVCAKDKNVYILNGKYQLQNNGDLEDGDEVIVRKSVKNKKPFEKVDKFVFVTDYSKILS